MKHSLLTGANLHEPKGVDSANPNTIYVADGLGSGSWEPRFEDAPVYAEIDKPAATHSLTSTTDVLIDNFAFDDYASASFTLTETGSKLTVVEAGLYLVTMRVRLTPQTSLSTSNEVVTAHWKINGTVSNTQRSVPVTITRNSTSSDPFTAEITRIIDFSAGQYLQLYLNNAASTRSYSVTASVNLVKFGNV